MDLRALILKGIKKKGYITTADLVGKTGFSRAYAQQSLKSLVEEGLIVLTGKANQARYIPPPKKGRALGKPLRVHRILLNSGLAEDAVLRQINTEGAIFESMADNVSAIVNYAFTEMLNNAIEHSRSEKIDVVMMKTATDIRFSVTDRGIGIFYNIMKTKHLGAVMEAIQDLLKGKQTTAPDAHSGEGIFFTSKIADRLAIRSFEKKIVFDNIGKDIYIKDVQPIKGTRVDFILNLKSSKRLPDLFRHYTDDAFRFSKTGVQVKLYHQDVDYVSRSQARRLLAGLEKFRTVELDFKDVKTVGQAFADEVFRVWQSGHKDAKLAVKNANENILFMIKRAQS